MLQTKKVDAQCDELATVESGQISATAPALNLPNLHLASPLGVTPLEFCQDFRQQKTRGLGLSCGVVYVILHSAVSVEHRLVTDGQTDDDS